MKKFLIPLTLLMSTSYMSQAQNPLFEEFKGVHQTAPFSAIDNTHWMPAIDRGIANAQAEVDAITRQRSTPDFDNTIVALERVGKDFTRVLNVFFPLLSADADDEMMNISIDASRKLSEYSTNMILNEELWKRVKYVYNNRELYNLTPEQNMLLQNTYDSFALSGAALEGEDRETFKKLNAELSELTTKFGQNVQKELPTYEVWLTAADIDGLPESSVKAAAEAAAEKGRAGEYLFTLDQPVYMAFMKYSSRPDLRERMYRLYTGRNTSGEYDNTAVLRRIAELRLQIARLLGSKDYASHSLQRTMAQSVEGVYGLLDRLRDAYKPALRKEMNELAVYASKLEGRDVTIMPWDYSYYANKLKSEKYSFDEEALRPYFELGNVVDGVFGLATKLYGLKFTENKGIEVYHPDVKAYDVADADGKFIGVLYTDFFPRASKRPGAWMTGFRDQCVTESGVDQRPHVSIVMNFTKPTGDTPSLLTPYEVETFLHEFGHALHGLLTDVNYASLSGTSVYRDFVELPSQFNENYLTEREFLDGFARHYKTGESIPQELVDGLVSSAQFGAAYACMRQLMFGYLDMAWHTIDAPVGDVADFERRAVKQVEIFAPVEGTSISPQFSHIFAGGYAAGYYSYKWAEVLDADAFSLFKKNGIFDKATADSFRTNILMKGGTENPAELYRRFRGQEPGIEALLERDGIKPQIALPEKR